MNKILMMLGLLFLNNAMAQEGLGLGVSDVKCTKGDDTFSFVVDLRMENNPRLWGLNLSSESDKWSDGYPLLQEIVTNSKLCHNISGFNDNPKVTFLCGGELFMLTNIYGQVQISSGAVEVLSEMLLKDDGWVCQELVN